MVKPVILSREANADRKQILEYWKARNKSDTYSKKLDKIFRENFELLSAHPKLGRLLGVKEIRAMVVKDYLVVYQETQTVVFVISIWDTRQNPRKLEAKLNA